MTEDLHALSEALRNPDPIVAADAARLIGEWRLSPLESALTDYLLSSRSYSKVSAIYALIDLAPERVTDVLKEIFQHPNVPNDFYWVGFNSVRTAAAYGLLTQGDSLGVDWLMERASVDDPLIFRWFAPALLRLPASSPVHAFLTVSQLCDTNQRDLFGSPAYSDPGQLCRLCEALGLLDDPEVSDHLEFYMHFHSRYVRGQAYRSYVLSQPGETNRKKVCQIAGRHGTDFEAVIAAELCLDALSLSKIATQSKHGFERVSALEVLVRTLPTEAIASLQAGLTNADPQVRQCCVEGLGKVARDADWEKALGSRETDVRVRNAFAAVRAGKEGRL